MFNDYYLKIGSTIINDPAPKKYELQSIYIDADSERNGNGDLVRNIVNKKYKIVLEFPPMKGAKLRALLLLFDNPNMSVEYYDEKTGSYRTGSFYAGDLVTNVLFKKISQDIVYDAFAINLIEY
jgi:DNA-dependent RNA polymerase auxiliary subunit epsilon